MRASQTAAEQEEDASVGTPQPTTVPTVLSPGGRHYEAWWTPGVQDPDPLARKRFPVLASSPATYAAAARGLQGYAHPASVKIDKIVSSIEQMKDMLSSMSITSGACGSTRTRPAPAEEEALDEYEKALSSVGRVSLSCVPSLGSFANVEALASWFITPLPSTKINPEGSSPKELAKGISNEWRGGNSGAGRWSEFTIILRAIAFAASGGDVFTNVSGGVPVELENLDDAAFISAARVIDTTRRSEKLSIVKFMKRIRKSFSSKSAKTA
jgi:hypothetical protein